MKKFNLVLTNRIDKVKNDEPLVGVTNKIPTYKLKNTYEKIIFPKLKRNEILENYIFCNKISKNLLLRLTPKLNYLHNENLENSDWDIIIGHWIRDYAEIMFKIFSQLNFIFKEHDILDVYTLKDKNYDFTSKDTISFRTPIYYDDQWYFLICAKMIKYFKLSNKVEFSHENLNAPNDNYVIKKSILGRTKAIGIYNYIFNCLKLLFNFNNYSVITKTYLPRYYEKLLEIKNNQIPVFYTYDKINNNIKNENLRKRLKLNKIENNNEFENFLTENINEFLPMHCVENYIEIKKIALGKKYPKNPKFIFTSQSFAYDEIFKTYVALNKRNKIPFYIGQHGNKYFTRIKNNFRPETNIADKFISWGAVKNDYMKTKIEQGFNFKTMGNKFEKKNSTKMIIYFPWVYTNINSLHTMENESYILMSRIKNIIEKLDEKIKKNLLLRFNKSFFKNFFGVKYFNMFKDLNLDYDDGNTPINQLYKKSKLNFFVLESTGVLESFHYNIPTIIFNEKNFLENINLSYVDKYEELLNNNILFTEEEDVINHINNNWDNTLNWWNTKQQVVNNFNKNLNNYSGKEGIDKINKILNN